MGGLGLAVAGNVVEFAFDGKQRGGLDCRRIDLLAHDDHLSLRQMMLLKYGFNGIEIVFRRKVHHGVVFVIKFAMGLGAFAVAFDQMMVIILVGIDVPIGIHGDKTGELQKPWIHLATVTGILNRHAANHFIFEPGDGMFQRKIIDHRGAASRVDGSTHHDHGLGRFFAMLGQQRHGGQYGNRRLANRDNVHV